MCLQDREESTEALQLELQTNSELLNMCAGNRTQVLCKCSTYPLLFLAFETESCNVANLASEVLGLGLEVSATSRGLNHSLRDILSSFLCLVTFH